ncbi:zinc finger C-x8-C-x5-C-x3-H type family protein [Actinidia rufa]|uniref:Zinc finger C-x8-C-x5-C-x3-H type family protein n=1 Tax=Actinidia rufa TaxID=165716 RepID=A0A7J0GJ43_9ERIC|nr:zinc finger C-x8-C-x5-C-x3-H type family protein [Actinidia rufa]
MNRCPTDIMNLFFLGNPIIVDFSPVTDFREATCRQYEEDICNRGGYCNFMHLKKISRELRRQLFGRGRRRQSRSPPRQRNYDDRPQGGRGSGRRGDDRDRRPHDRSKRPRSRSPGRNRGRSRSPREHRNRSPVREGSAERRAKIEQWNREREQAESVNKHDRNNNDNDNKGNGVAQNGEQYDDPQHQQDHGGYDY